MPNLENEVLMCTPNHPHTEGIKRSSRLNQPVIMGTPGLFAKFVKMKVFDLRNVTMFVLDEADIMINSKDGLGKTIQEIKKNLPKNCQKLLFSATFEKHVCVNEPTLYWTLLSLFYVCCLMFNEVCILLSILLYHSSHPLQVRKFAETFVGKPCLPVYTDDIKIERLKQYWIRGGSNNDEKRDMLKLLYDALKMQSQSIIFCQTREECRELSEFMISNGYVSTVLTAGGGSQSQKAQLSVARDQVLREFKEGLTKILICTNVAARGIDIPGVLLVINYDMPRKRGDECDLETYVQSSKRWFFYR
jgi:ATP-dependent RNA helicase DDX19/DBP5